jgi:hypothetical protein
MRIDGLCRDGDGGGQTEQVVHHEEPEVPRLGNAHVIALRTKRPNDGPITGELFDFEKEMLSFLV